MTTGRARSSAGPYPTLLSNYKPTLEMLISSFLPKTLVQMYLGGNLQISVSLPSRQSPPVCTCTLCRREPSIFEALEQFGVTEQILESKEERRDKLVRKYIIPSALYSQSLVDLTCTTRSYSMSLWRCEALTQALRPDWARKVLVSQLTMMAGPQSCHATA